MEFHVIELPKLPEDLTENCTDLELWAKFISAERKEEFDMLAEKNPYIDSAYQKLQVISQDSQKRLEYEAREKAIRDYNEGMYEAEQRGIQIGEQRIIKLYSLLTRDKRYTDMEHSTNDTGFLKQLLEEYGL